MGSTPSRPSRSGTCRASTGAGPSSRRRSTWRCARRASGSRRRWGARRARRLRLLDAALPGGDQPSTIGTLNRKLDRYPDLRFKLDPTNDWTDELIAELVATGAVDSLDLKGQYKGTVVDVETDPDLYRKLIEAFPDAWLEDPDVNEETRPILEPVRDRLTWDAPIHSIADIEALPWQPKMVNVKPSRLGGLRDLCETYDYCAEHGIGAYGGGQWELGVGRGQIQVLASLFPPRHPQRHRAPRLQRGRPSGRPADQPDGAEAVGNRISPSRLERNRRVRDELRHHPQRAGRLRVRRPPAVRGDRGALRRGDAAPAGRLLLPPGDRGAQPRDDDRPVPARRRARGDGPGSRGAAEPLRRHGRPRPAGARPGEAGQRAGREPGPAGRARRATTRASSSCSGSSRSRSRRSPRCRRC